MAGKPLHFCMITTFYPPLNFGGDGIFVQRLAQALVARGHRVTVIHCADAYRISGGEKALDTAQTVIDGISVHRLQSRLGPVSPLVTHQTGHPGLKAQALRAVFAANDFDVIHFHNVSLIGGAGVLDYGSGVKLYTAHEYWLICPLSTLWTYRGEPCSERRCVRCMIGSGRPPQLWRSSALLRGKLGQLDAVFAPSRFSINKHHENGLDVDFIHLPNFLPRSSQRLAAAATDSHRPYFLLVGRMEESKGFQRIIAFFKEFNEADLVLAGTGPYLATLQTLAADSEHVRFLGQQTYDELQSLYAAASAVIVPSLWDEPFGLIVLEAFAQKTPVIAHHAGALPELIEQSGGGFVYENERGLHDAVTSILHSPVERTALGERGHRTWLRLWTEESHLDQYLGVIQSIRESKQATRDNAQP